MDQLFSRVVSVHSLFHCALQLCLRFGQFLPQTLALLGTPLKFLQQVLQVHHCLLVCIILLMVKHIISIFKFYWRYSYMLQLHYNSITSLSIQEDPNNFTHFGNFYFIIIFKTEFTCNWANVTPGINTVHPTGPVQD